MDTESEHTPNKSPETKKESLLGTVQKFTAVHPEVPLNPDVHVGVWVRVEGLQGDWFVSAIHGDFAQLSQAGKITARRRGKCEVVPW
jgi:hypothetical protein